MKRIAAGLTAIALTSCSSGAGGEVYTLYRTSIFDDARIHVATFDASDQPVGYNRGNCEMVVRYLSEQPEVPQGYYWCERGRFEP